MRSAQTPSFSFTDKSRVAERFDTVAERYDLLQRFNPGYRKHLHDSARRLAAPPRGRLLDLCCGTGLSTEALVACYPDSTVCALDASAGMLAVARQKAALSQVTFLQGDAGAPQQAGLRGPFDAVLMAYGIRNLVDADACLQQIRGLLRSGGQVAFHEYSVRDSLYARALWNAVARSVIVPLGKALTGETALFRYLQQSVNAFDGLFHFERRLQRAGFTDVRVASMDGWQRGIVHTILARSPA